MYGLSDNAVSENTNDSRKAQIFQLKGYLLFFEQVMANYLEQLSRFNELYSLDKKLTKSYFVQIPSDIPEMYSLVSQLSTTDDPSKFESKFKKFNL